MAPAVVPKARGSHKDYFAIFSQTMNLMPNIFLQARCHLADIIQLWHLWLTVVTTITSALKSLTFFFRQKNKILLMKPLTLSRTFPYLLIFPSTKLWSSYITWLYIKRTKLRTKGQTNPSLSHPIILKLHQKSTN